MIRRQFAMKGGAQSFEKFIKEQAQDKPWLGDKADKRRTIMAFACEVMGNQLATKFNAKIFASYRE